MTYIDKIIAFESGILSNEKTIELFSELIKNKQAWALQGMYGRMADSFIEKGILLKDGTICWDVYHDLINAVN